MDFWCYYERPKLITFYRSRVQILSANPLLVFINMHNTSTLSASVDAAAIAGPHDRGTYKDVWSGDETSWDRLVSATVAPHAATLLRLSFGGKGGEEDEERGCAEK